MGKTNPQLNHSRTLNLYAKDLAEDMIMLESIRPTKKQERFCWSLQKQMKEHDLEPVMPSYDRGSYSRAIDEMIAKLYRVGVVINTNYDPNIGDKEEPVWINPKISMPEETEIIDDSMKNRIKNLYKVKNPRTSSGTVKVQLKDFSTWYSTGIVVNGKFAFSDPGDRKAVVVGWLPIN